MGNTKKLAWRAILLSVLGLAGSAAGASGQDLPPPVESSGPPAAVTERQGTSVATLESLTGQRVQERPEEEDEIETDRDSFTPATVIAPRRRFILESAYTFTDNRGFKESHSFPETILRYGLTDRIELRLGWNAEMGGGGDELSGSDAGGEFDPLSANAKREYNISYGVKLRVTDQKRWMPRSIAIIQAATPTGGSTGTSTATALIATYAAGWVFSNKWQFDAAMRYGYDSERGDHFNHWAPSAVLRIPLGEKLATHIEYFSLLTSGKEENTTKHYISPGVRYLVTSNLELGVRVGWGLNQQSARFFTNAGFGWRF